MPCSPVQAWALVELFLLHQPGQPGPHPALYITLSLAEVSEGLQQQQQRSGLAPPKLTSVLDWAGRNLTESCGKIVFFICFL